MGQKDVSNMEKLGLPNGKKTIEPGKLNAYIRYFGVSADYLLGFTDNMQEHINPDDMACADYIECGFKVRTTEVFAENPSQTPLMTRSEENIQRIKKQAEKLKIKLMDD